MIESILNSPKIRMSMSSEARLVAWNKWYVTCDDINIKDILIKIEIYVDDILKIISNNCEKQRSYGCYRIPSSNYNPYAVRWVIDWLEWNQFIVKEVDCRNLNKSIIIKIEW